MIVVAKFLAYQALTACYAEHSNVIVSVADVLDALTADRPYSNAMPIPKALDIMRADLGTAFDPECFASPEQALAKIEGDLARAA